ncbi:MAG: hypothetical protein LRY69_02315 [Gammaproteobacteria bacterium]|nr:hypothetical protein [Gammaproteobacteria bacterium]
MALYDNIKENLLASVENASDINKLLSILPKDQYEDILLNKRLTPFIINSFQEIVINLSDEKKEFVYNMTKEYMFTGITTAKGFRSFLSSSLSESQKTKFLKKWSIESQG